MEILRKKLDILYFFFPEAKPSGPQPEDVDTEII